MKIYLAGEVPSSYMDDEWISQLWRRSVKRRLFSYYYHGFSGHRFKQSRPGVSVEVDRALEEGLDLFLDSGAFTAFTKGVEIGAQEYAKYVKWSKRAWTVCSSLDAIGHGEEAAQKSYSYFTQLRELGADVQPVFHVREPDRWLQRYIDEGYEYIFIGGMVPETTGWLYKRLDGLWDSILTNKDGTPKVRTHGFGLTDSKLMFRFPWYSVDSTSWLMTGIFGACQFRDRDPIREVDYLRKVVFSKDSPSAEKIDAVHFDCLVHEEQERVRELLFTQFGEVTPDQLASHYRHRNALNAAAYQDIEDMGATHFHIQQPTIFGGLE